MSLKSRFCVKCGNEAEQLADNLCAKCYFGKFEITVPEKITIINCSKCGSIRIRGMWAQGYTLEEFFRQELVTRIKLPDQADLVKVEVLKFGKEAQVLIKVRIIKQNFEKQFTIKVNLIDNLCPDCSRSRARTHTGVIQLRTDGNVDTFLNKVWRFGEKYKPKLLKVIEQSRGIDLYFLDKESVKHLAGELKNELGCKITETRELYSWDKTKNRPKTRLILLAKERQ